jgi:glycosyltransferase involved in cell wall biosynthesis
MIKILLVSSLYPDAQKPGYGIFVQNCENNLKSNGFEIERAVIAGTPSGFLHKIALYISFYARILYMGFFGRHDIIYGHFVSHICIPLYLISLIKNVKIVINIHGGDISVEGGLRKLIYRLLLNPFIKKIFAKAALVIAPSRYYKKILTARYKLENDKIFVSPSGGVDAAKFKPLGRRECRNKLAIAEDNFVIGYISRLETNKGWRFFLEAAAALKKSGVINKLSFLAVGGGSQRAGFDETVRALGLEKEIKYIPKASHEELERFYGAMDLFIFPTLKESLGLVGIEAMACGLPVIGSRIGALCEYIIEGKNGFFFKTGDSEELKDKIEYYYKLPDDCREKIFEAALKTASYFDSKAVSNKLSAKLSAL